MVFYVDINALDEEDHWSPLHYASFYNHCDVIQWLLEQSNMNVAIQDPLGRTALHLSAGAGHVVV